MSRRWPKASFSLPIGTKLVPRRVKKSEAQDKLESKGALKCGRWAQDISEWSHSVKKVPRSLCPAAWKKAMSHGRDPHDILAKRE